MVSFPTRNEATFAFLLAESLLGFWMRFFWGATFPSCEPYSPTGRAGWGSQSRIEYSRTSALLHLDLRVAKLVKNFGQFGKTENLDDFRTMFRSMANPNPSSSQRTSKARERKVVGRLT